MRSEKNYIDHYGDAVYCLLYSTGHIVEGEKYFGEDTFIWEVYDNRKKKNNLVASGLSLSWEDVLEDVSCMMLNIFPMEG